MKSVDPESVRFHYQGAWRRPPEARRHPSRCRMDLDPSRAPDPGPVERCLRAAGYTPSDIDRYVLRLRQKLDEGLTIKTP